MPNMRLDLSEHGELNMKVFVLCKYINWGLWKNCLRIRALKFTNERVTKRGNEYGDDVWDAPCSKHPMKITKMKKNRVLEVVDLNLRLTF